MAVQSNVAELLQAGHDALHPCGTRREADRQRSLMMLCPAQPMLICAIAAMAISRNLPANEGWMS